jgi:cytochrome b
VAAPDHVVVWDPLVRIFHWATVGLFMADYWLLEPGEAPHEWAGYALALLLLVRIVWGFAGPPNARFATFFPTPARLRLHWQRLRSRNFDPREGHNPVGALMILSLMVLLAVTAISGWMQGLDRFWGEDWVQRLHQFSADAVMVLVVVHVAGVLVVSRLAGFSLIRSMISGRRPLPANSALVSGSDADKPK